MCDAVSARTHTHTHTHSDTHIVNTKLMKKGVIST